MQKKYTPKEVESKWQSIWEREKLYWAEDFSKKKKFYLLIEFPYTSGAGLHVGHVRSYGAMDAYGRRKRMQGFNVLYPVGWDAFGLPAENYAIKMGLHPSKTVSENITTFKRQIKSLGLSFDWNREIDTTDPKYYKWTQWIFVQLFKKGLAYQAEVPVNWCPKCKTNLADEEVLANGNHERCGAPTERRPQKQWLLRITKYAERLLNDLKLVDYSPQIALQQVNWIGKSEGILFKEKVKDLDIEIEVFDTVPQTFIAQTFTVIAPEHPLVKKLVEGTEYEKEVIDFVRKIKEKKLANQFDIEKETEGVFTGRYVENPFGKGDLPIWVASYAIYEYGTGIVNCSAHDERDFAFAKKYQIPLRIAMLPKDENLSEKVQKFEICYHHDPEGIIQEPVEFKGLYWEEALKPVMDYIFKKGLGKKQANYHLRDWVFSRQHYWGEPIPIIHCKKCGPVAVPEEDLPVELPYLEKYEPSGTGESPLAKIEKWVKMACPECGGAARRETDTMPNWAGSNWYFVRYLDPQNDQELASKKKMDYWLPVDLYQGGFEHTTLHLLYSRFIYKFLYDIGAVPGPEPYAKRRSHGIVLGADGRKMSKSFGNVINPDQIVAKYGADTLRIYEMFMGPFDQMVAWSEESLEGCYRFLGRVWRAFGDKVTDKKTSPELITKLHQTIKKVDSDLEAFKFNTIISSLMEFVNAWEGEKSLNKEEAKLFAKTLAPFVPHLAEEIWVEILKQDFSIHTQGWPKDDPGLILEEDSKMVVQVNGKVRGQLTVKRKLSESKTEIEKLAKQEQKVSKYLKGEQIKKVIFVPGKLINFVV